jgi:RibD C-terminal domain
MEPIRTLFATEADAPSGAVLPDDLRARYDGNLSFPPAPEQRPYFIANFVSTLDGVVSFNLPGQSGGAQISGSNEEDRFIMGLLRASADAVLVGSGTLQAVGPQGSWLPESVYPAAKDLYRKYRTEVLRKLQDLLVVIVAGGGSTGPHQHRVSYATNQSAHTDHRARKTAVVAKWIGGTPLSRGEGSLYGRDAHLSFRDAYVTQTRVRCRVAASRSRADTLRRISRRRICG